MYQMFGGQKLFGQKWQKKALSCLVEKDRIIFTEQGDSSSHEK